MRNILLCPVTGNPCCWRDLAASGDWIPSFVPTHIALDVTLSTVQGVISNTTPWFRLPPVFVVPKTFPSLSTATLP
jgi:hypothetical protein